jgi:ethanolamine utilization protein EutA
LHWDLDEDLLYDGEDEHDFISEKIEFLSVGIDIGSSTSHLMFSELTLRRRGKEYYGGYTVTNREITYQSPIILTPYLEDNQTIDIDKLRNFIQESYKQAGFKREDIDTGAVITTGEAAKKRNANNIIQLFADETGKFVTAAAGPVLESMLSANGSGAVRLSLSKQHASKVMNVDIGGGTTKMSIIEKGHIMDTCVINMGARLIAWDESGRINRIEDAGRQIAEEIGIPLEIGQKLSDQQKLEISNQIRDKIAKFIMQQNDDGQKYIITDPLKENYQIGSFVFSGGVSEYIYGHEKDQHGDLGKILGEGLRQWFAEEKLHHHKPLQYIRATVIGASQYTIQVSGNTIYLTDPDVLPLRNHSVVSFTYNGQECNQVCEEVKRAYSNVDFFTGEGNTALSVTWQSETSYQEIEKFVGGFRKALIDAIPVNLPLVVLFDIDIAGVIGSVISDRMTNPLVVLDLVNLKELDFVDIGEELDNKAVPVTVKSLIFK